mmetsp:Transcript_3394/g.5926  ORF Transcript_3394/g.5926 Transcript_3394/m.5926 type:complete len:213 (+) Transcript_3394:1158-1796(+)
MRASNSRVRNSARSSTTSPTRRARATCSIPCLAWTDRRSATFRCHATPRFSRRLLPETASCGLTTSPLTHAMRRMHPTTVCQRGIYRSAATWPFQWFRGPAKFWAACSLAMKKPASFQRVMRNSWRGSPAKRRPRWTTPVSTARHNARSKCDAVPRRSCCRSRMIWNWLRNGLSWPWRPVPSSARGSGTSLPIPSPPTSGLHGRSVCQWTVA